MTGEENKQKEKKSLTESHREKGRIVNLETERRKREKERDVYVKLNFEFSCTVNATQMQLFDRPIAVLDILDMHPHKPQHPKQCFPSTSCG